MTAEVTMGPILFHWPEEQKRDFYFRIADESSVSTVYIGEVICSKRIPFFEKNYRQVADRLKKAGKKIVYSTIAEVMTKYDRKLIKDFCDMVGEEEIEVNDASALLHISGKSHRIGQYINAYNEETMGFLVGKGAKHFTLQTELPSTSIDVLGKKAKELRVGLEIQVFGRVSLALSARCYAARAHGKIKDNCNFVCELDPDGMKLETLSNEEFLSINGIQTMSYNYLNLINELGELQKMGVTHFRLSPHTQDMVGISNIFKNVLDNKLSSDEALNQLKEFSIPASFSNGFYYSKPGHEFVLNS